MHNESDSPWEEKGLRRGREAPWNSGAAADVAGEAGRWVSRVVSLIKRHHLTAEYAAIHPHMVVPALVNDGELIIESMDIVAYLDERFGGEPLIPVAPDRRARALELVEKAKKVHRSVRFVSFRWSLGKLAVLRPAEEARLRELELPESPEKLVDFYEGYDSGTIPEETFIKHLRALEQGFAELEQALTDSDFLVGDTFTVADIPWSIKVLRLTECGYPFQQNYPRLAEWFDQVSQRPAFRESVMGKHRLMSAAFRFKAKVDAAFGKGIARHAQKQVA